MWWLVAGVAALVVLDQSDAFDAGVTDAVQALLGPTSLLPDGTVSVDGETPADPQALADAVGRSLDVYALARMIACCAIVFWPPASLAIKRAVIQTSDSVPAKTPRWSML